MFSLTRMDDQAFCYRGFFSPGGEAFRAAGCNKTPVTKPWSSMCVSGILIHTKSPFAFPHTVTYMHNI